jgi:photosystem II stability/assembly factor-like uncharacterized protein
MKRWLTALAVSAACSLALLPGAKAQDANGKTNDVFSHMQFQNLGPAVAGGRVATVVGVPGNPNVYYVGAAGGGVWKTINGGDSWKAVFEHEGSSSIGAIALAPSNPQLVWVGTGEANIRNDIIDGSGVYFSADGGNTWKFMGLGDAGQISTILVDPHDSSTVFVGVLGHAWGPNAERGVFKTTDGGKTWKKVLFVDDSTGVSDMVMQPGNPHVLFAGTWQVRRYPWTLDDGGPGSGIYRSTDAGDTWTKLTKGLPEGPLGRIALAVAPTNPDHVYALVEAKHGLLWQSENMGDSWTAASDNHALDVRPFYFSRVFVSPNDENKLFFCGFQLMESDNGGRTARPIDQGVHVDHHALWIDPTNPDRMIQGNDGGAYATQDGGKTWRFLDGMPIAEEYMVGLTSNYPYTLCAGLQDNNAWCGNQLEGWYTVAGGDGEYAVPAPSDPNIIYVDSQNGSISRLDLAHHTRWSIRPYSVGVEEEVPSNLKYRFNWTSPIAVSPTDANVVYLGGNVLFRSTDGGKTWAPISPDLTYNDKSKQVNSGGPINLDLSGAETYDTIISITLAPGDPNVIWVGSDDGKVHVTRNGGKTWTDVTANITGAPKWARVYQLGVSPFDPGTAYATFDAHMIDNRHPYVFRTRDYGKTWQQIVNGLPDASVHVVREDPNQRGLLVLGCDTGLYYSTNDGDQWQKFPVKFPVVPVWDVQFAKAEHDLTLATHGRGFFVLNDIRPVEEMTSEVASSNFHLFQINNATLANRFFGGKQGQRSTTYRVPPAPQGAMIDYFLKTAIKGPHGPGAQGGPGERGGMRGAGPMGPGSQHGPVKIVIANAAGDTVATHYGPGDAGVNRFAWNLRYQEPVPYRGAPAPRRGGGGGFFFGAGGPEVAPGSYKVTVTAGDQTQTQTVEVAKDPSATVAPGAFAEQVAYGLQARDMMSSLNETLNQIDSIDHQISGFAEDVRPADGQDPNPKYKDLVSAGRSLHMALEKLKNELYNTKVQRAAPEDDIHFLADLHDSVQGLLRGGSIGYGQPPTPQAKERMAQVRQELSEKLADFDQILKTQLKNYNHMAEKVGAPQLFAGEPITLPATKSAARR